MLRKRKIKLEREYTQRVEYVFATLTAVTLRKKKTRIPALPGSDSINRKCRREKQLVPGSLGSSVVNGPVLDAKNWWWGFNHRNELQRASHRE